MHPFSTTDGNTKTIAVLAAAVVAADDITIKLTGPGGVSLGTYDLATSPETATYTAPGGGTLAQGDYGVQVCAFDGAQIPGRGLYTVAVTIYLDAGRQRLPAVCRTGRRGAAFAANPNLDSVSPARRWRRLNSVIECWVTQAAP